MVKQIIRHLYECETCGEEYERYHLAKKCEEEHVKNSELRKEAPK
jgi:hypothetical protein